MVSLSTKQRGVAVVAVLTLGLLFGIALLMMHDALPMAETNLSSVMTVSMTLHTLDTSDADTVDDFTFVNTANGKVLSQYQVSQPGRDKGKSKTLNLALNEELGELFCLCTTGDDLWDGELSVFKVNDVSFPGVVSTLRLSKDDPGHYPCWMFGIESDELVDKGHSTECSTTVSMTFHTLTDPDSQTGDDFDLVNTANGKEVARYKVSQPGTVKGESKTISLVLNEKLGQLFCLCQTYEDYWNGEVSDLKVGSVSYPGVVSPVKLSKNDPGFYPCWRFGIESNELVDKGYSQECSVSTNEVSMNLHTLTIKTDSYTNDDVNFVNTADGKMVAQYRISQPGPVNGESKVVSLTLNEQLGNVFCLCAITDDAWDVEVSELKVGDVSFPGVVSPVRLSTDDTEYYPCWRFGIEWEELVDKGHFKECSMYTVSMKLHTLSIKTDSYTEDNINFVNTADGKVVGTYEMYQPGPVNEESRMVTLELNEQLGSLFCLCATNDDAWDVEVSDFKVGSESFSGVVSPVRLSTWDTDYYPCWRFAIESEDLVDKGHSDSCI